ncbi:MAG: DNA-binding protein [Planctomycetota bacterium]|nr:DNA-binding protein [Planctomycetota bacterium]
MTTSTWTSPAKIAKELGLRQSKPLDWIRSGELIAINVAEHTGGKPRWRIRQSDWEDFLLRRQSQKPAEPIRRRRRDDPTVIKFF